ncbi:hypothetical protein [Pseudactinotalea sp. Z1748]|uniref:hypothetical protein n=1 Tax=Pseudactinotalea sp. Z1748 TaxID=3413027 RepID=UPI003C7C3230
MDILDPYKGTGDAPPTPARGGFMHNLSSWLRGTPWWGWALFAGALGGAGWYAYWGATEPHWVW